MKPAFCIFLILLIPAGLCADVCVKSVYHYESRYHHGSLQPEYQLVYEWWIGENYVSLISQEYRNYENYLLEPSMRITLDRNNKRVIVVNASDSTYVVVPLPTDFKSAVDSGFIEALNGYRIKGAVQETGEKTKLRGKICSSFLVTESIYYGGNVFYERERKLMSASELPFDWRAPEELLEWIRSFFNPEPEYSSALKKISGFIYAANDVRFSRGNKLVSDYKITEISQKDPPDGVYSIPDGLNEIARLTQDYIIALRGLIFQTGG
jgi:hypothetical protein